MKSSRQSASRLAVAASCLLAMQPAFAQIEEIVVTAQRREENQQQVPISISTATAAVLESAGVQSTDELGLFAPGLTIQRQIGSVLPYIRGIGNPNTSGGQESAVAMYVDGIYYAQLPSTNFSLNNIERIEVLKGPQGTLFGRNATGGLVQIVTRDPEADFNGGDWPELRRLRDDRRQPVRHGRSQRPIRDGSRAVRHRSG